LRKRPHAEVQKSKSSVPTRKKARYETTLDAEARAKQLKTESQAKGRIQVIRNQIREHAWRVRFRQRRIRRLNDERLKIETLFHLPVTKIWTNDDGSPLDRSDPQVRTP
jgi:hypothetical protein